MPRNTKNKTRKNNTEQTDANPGKQAVIYARISSKAQEEKGTGLESQATRCREFAGYKGLEVIKTFQDQKTGSAIDRPGMKDMLAFLRCNRKKRLVVIIDDISRFARGLEAHLALRAAVANSGATLMSPTIEFGEDSDSKLVENLLATVAQHQREKNAEQTVNRMRARVMNGFWVHPTPPIGYRYQKTKDRGKVLMREEPFASIIQQALEGYASGRFQLQHEVKRFFESFPVFPRDKKGEVRHQRVRDILTNVIYTGYIESRGWDVSLREGQQEGLISFKTYQKIQKRLNEKANVPARKDLNRDFVLRGFVTCGDCGHPMTACWSKGKTKKHPYYLCFKKGCVSYRKSIRRDVLEGEFKALLATLRPTQALFDTAKHMFKDLWDHQLEFVEQMNQSMKTQINKIEKQVEQLLNRIMDVNSQTVINAYEQRIQTLEAEKVELLEKIKKSGRPVRGFDKSFRTAMQFLANPCILWNSERFEDKRAVLKLAFASKLAYSRNEGFRTPETTLPFKALGGIQLLQNKMAERQGFEPWDGLTRRRFSKPVLSATQSPLQFSLISERA